MSKRKISECINIRINVGNYQHIELSKYAEEEIEYSNESERLEKEDRLRDDLILSLTRSMKTIPEKLGKGIENAIEVEQSIKKAIPEWLSKNSVPNIVNNAKKIDIKVSAEQKSQKDKAINASKEFESEIENKKEMVTSASSNALTQSTKDDLFDDDLFSDNKE